MEGAGDFIGNAMQEILDMSHKISRIHGIPPSGYRCCHRTNEVLILASGMLYPICRTQIVQIEWRMKSERLGLLHASSAR